MRTTRNSSTPCAGRRVTEAGRRREVNGHEGWRVSAHAATQHVAELMRGGMSRHDIAARSGMSYSVVTEVGAGRSERIHRITEESILGVKVPESNWEPAGNGYVGAAGSSRRLQALGVQGFPLSFLCQETGLSKSRIGVIRSGSKPVLMMSGFRLIRDVHDKFWDVDPLDVGLREGAVCRTRLWAKRHKWWPTEAWSDIDDPACKPSLKTPRYVILAEGCQELMQVRGSRKEDVAKRLGVSVNTLDKAVGYYNAKAS